jgi:hypothetical protein
LILFNNVLWSAISVANVAEVDVVACDRREIGFVPKNPTCDVVDVPSRTDVIAKRFTIWLLNHGSPDVPSENGNEELYIFGLNSRLLFITTY